MSSPSNLACQQPYLSIVVPVFNEEGGVVTAIDGLRRELPDAEIIIVDDGSSDRTAERLNGLEGVVIFRHAFNRGYGAALKTGMRRARGHYIAWFDGDGQHRAEDLVRMVQRLHDDDLAAIIGQRLHGGATRTRSFGKLVIRLFAWLMRFRAGHDLNCGLRVFHRDVILRYVALLPDGFSASMTSTMIMVEHRYPVAFEPISLNPRIGTTKVVLSDGFESLALVARMIMLFAPLRIFFNLGLSILIGAGLYGLWEALSAGFGFPALAVTLMLMGFLLCLLGLIADQISYMRLSQLDALAPIDVVATDDDD